MWLSWSRSIVKRLSQHNVVCYSSFVFFITYSFHQRTIHHFLKTIKSLFQWYPQPSMLTLLPNPVLQPFNWYWRRSQFSMALNMVWECYETPKTYKIHRNATFFIYCRVFLLSFCKVFISDIFQPEIERILNMGSVFCFLSWNENREITNNSIVVQELVGNHIFFSHFLWPSLCFYLSDT